MSEKDKICGYINIVSSEAPSSKWLGHRPFKAEMRVQIPSGLPKKRRCGNEGFGNIFETLQTKLRKAKIDGKG